MTQKILTLTTEVKEQVLYGDLFTSEFVVMQIPHDGFASPTLVNSAR